MEQVSKAIAAYDKYCDRFSSGFLNASFENGLTGAIALSDSSISIPGISPGFVDHFKALMGRMEHYATLYGDQRFELPELIKRVPEVAECAEHIELWRHEAFHGVQKHAYRSVFSLVDAIQGVEGWENSLFFMHASSGGVWRLGGSFISSLQEIDESLRDRLAELLERQCKIILEATQERANGIGLLHLIEGQAMVASRLAAGLFDHRPLPEADVYTKAWHEYQKAHGADPLVFVLVVSAALRYGDINDDDESAFYDFYPHPVDIFNYLINFAPEIETVFHAVDRLPFASGNGFKLFAGTKSIPETSPAYQDALNKLLARVSTSGISPADSVDELLSYVRASASPGNEETPVPKEDTSRWYYHNCGRCNADGSFAHVDPDCGRCSGIGEDWDEGEDARERLRNVYGSEPKTGTPPQYNRFGRRLFTSVEESETYENQREHAELDQKHHDNIWSAFDDLQNDYTLDPREKKQAIKSALLVSKAIAQVLELTYTRVAQTLKDEFPTESNKKIADAVANDYVQRFPDYYQEETIIRTLLDQEFVLGQLFGYFLYGINVSVMVKPFDSMPEMSHGEYLSMRLLPETIKKLLLAFQWKDNGGPVPQLPYCCQEHGVLTINDSHPTFLDDCSSEDGVGQAMQILLKRSIQSFFK